MAQAVLYSKTGTKKETAVKLPAAVFGTEPNHSLISAAYETYVANGRHAGAKTLTRGEVRGGGKKPWKQKGTGRARAGSSRLPHWTGGGVAFGPVGLENHSKSMPVKAKRAAIRGALSLQATDQKIMVIEDFVAPDGKVSATVKLLNKLEVEGSIVLVVATKDTLIDRATRNMPGVNVVSATYLNVFTILNADAIIMTQAALEQVEAWLGAADSPAAKQPEAKKPAAAKKPTAKKAEAKA
ncbi:MAG TPA: 50S ribosomal protein L4 [Candidatus Saccharimonadia bacterium]